MLRHFKVVVLAGFLLSMPVVRAAPSLQTTLPAFPGAQGGGASSVGGRGGSVIEVTNLEDAGPGSLRAALLTPGPRTVVFRVGGTIRLKSAILISEPYLTVAGQTAPGGGILLIGPDSPDNMIIITAHDVIWRYMKIAKGFNQTTLDIFRTRAYLAGTNLMVINEAYNVIVDHNSSWWNQDESLSAWDAGGNITFSHNLLAEGLYPHSTGFLTGGETDLRDVDFHHNLTISNTHRNPILTGTGSSRFVNNITYNTAVRLMQLSPRGGVLRTDIIGNLMKKGPLNWSYGYDPYEVAGTDGPSIYIADNKGFTPGSDDDQWMMVRNDLAENGPDAGPAPTSWRRDTPLPDTLFPVIAEPVARIEGSILPTVGASRRLNADGEWVANRTTVDARLIREYQTNSGLSGELTHENQVGGFPVIDAGDPYEDADHDGMPDPWETARGLNPNDPSDRNRIAPSGYTYLEEFINGPEPTEIFFSSGEPLSEGSTHGSGEQPPCGFGLADGAGGPWPILLLAALSLATALFRGRQSHLNPRTIY